MYDIDGKNFDDKIELRKDNNFIFNLDIDGFNGPLDLLLQLAQTKKLDITKISILELVDQYLSFIKKAKELDLHIASDYLVMAAILAFIKSKMLLPTDDKNETNKNNELEKWINRTTKPIIGINIHQDMKEKTFISSTFWTERIGPVAALKTLEIMEK